MSYYDYHPELGEKDYIEQQAVLANLAEQDEALETAQADADADAEFFAMLDKFHADNAEASLREQVESMPGWGEIAEVA